MAYQKLILEKKNGVAKITLNRPEAMNAIDESLWNEIVAALDEIEKDDSVNVIILTGAGRCFSTGRDLPGIMAGREFPAGKRADALENCSKPVIAAVHGYCFTGAFELVMCADIVIAAENVIFGDTHTRFGIIPGGGQTQRLPRHIGPHKAKELLFTGDTVSAKEAERIGIVNKVVPTDKLQEAAMEMAEKILKNIPETVRTTKSLINRGLKVDYQTGLKLEAEVHIGKPISPTEEGKQRIAALLKKK
jgi:enoyl-CoA hydratase/carnithine racemase